MLIERLRSSPDGAIAPGSWEEIKKVELQARDEFMDFVRASGAVNGEYYSAFILQATELDPDLKEWMGVESGEFYVEKRRTSDPLVQNTFVFDVCTGLGIQREERDADTGLSPKEYYLLDEIYWETCGSKLLEELFKPGTHPELSELALSKRSSLVDPAECSARVMTVEEYKRSVATARLGRFMVSHLERLVSLYHHAAYTQPEPYKLTQQLLEAKDAYQDLRQGVSLNFRTGTEYLDCAKHVLRPDLPSGTLATHMYLNYDIQLGSVNLHFRDDIDMAVNFGEQARAYFQEQGIDQE